MFWVRCKAPACRPCTAADPRADVIKVDLANVERKSDARDIVAEAQDDADDNHQGAVEAPGAVLAHIKEAAREWLGHLADIALEYTHEELAAATGNFAKERCLGAGGAGAVYRGKLRGGTEVAVKALSDLGGLEGFEEEVRVLSKFRHPNLVTLYGWGQHEKTKYIVYELLPGGDLQGRLRSRKGSDPPFTWQERLRVALGAASGLSHMMNSKPKAFHRDIKPPNILIDVDGTAKMADFGLAAVLQGNTEESDDMHIAVDQVSGTPGYMCPTYMQTARVTEQSEAYSFGTVLLELLVNKPPALMTNHGDLMFPLLELLQPAAPGAHGRALSSVDPSASWPRHLAEEFADVALACVDLELGRRPCFRVMVEELRRMTRHSSGGYRAAEVPLAPTRSSSQRPVRPSAGAQRMGTAPKASRSCTGQEDAASTSGGEACTDSEAATGDEAEVVHAAADRAGGRNFWWA